MQIQLVRCHLWEKMSIREARGPLFYDAFTSPFNNKFPTTGQIDLYQTNDEILVEIFLPDPKAGDLQIMVNSHGLTL